MANTRILAVAQWFLKNNISRPVDCDPCRRLWRFSDSCYAGYGEGGQQQSRSKPPAQNEPVWI